MKASNKATKKAPTSKPTMKPTMKQFEASAKAINKSLLNIATSSVKLGDQLTKLKTLYTSPKDFYQQVEKSFLIKKAMVCRYTSIASKLNGLKYPAWGLNKLALLIQYPELINQFNDESNYLDEVDLTAMLNTAKAEKAKKANKAPKPNTKPIASPVVVAEAVQKIEKKAKAEKAHASAVLASEKVKVKDAIEKAGIASKKAEKEHNDNLTLALRLKTALDRIVELEKLLAEAEKKAEKKAPKKAKATKKAPKATKATKKANK